MGNYEISDQLVGRIKKVTSDDLKNFFKAEVDAVAAEMKKDIADFKAFQAQQFSTLNSTLSDIKGQVTNTNAELTAVKGQIEGMKTSYTSIQWMVGAILMVLALILALPQVQGYLKSPEQPVSSNMQQSSPTIQVAPPQAQSEPPAEMPEAKKTQDSK
ncbi:hypothetical protein [Providencia rustigianii]|uniref:hypothetical protein n=1 Tax=Providencia rustigianii TaxID=158850 RepID=UPI0038B3C988